MGTPKQSISKLLRVEQLGIVELLHGQQLTHSFPKHTHEEYAFGVIEQGALGFHYRGENVTASAGQINLCIPGEVHTGYPVTEAGWSYRMFYFDPLTLQKIASEISGRANTMPFFNGGTIVDPLLAQQLRALHIELEQAPKQTLAHESTLVDLLAQLIIRYADAPFAPQRISNVPRAVQQIQAYIEQHYADAVTLDTLAAITNFSRYHLIRAFRAATGVPPHAYLRQVRVRQAKRLIAEGQSIADAALAVGFTDQSHLTRWFKRLWGITPGQYRNSVQEMFT